MPERCTNPSCLEHWPVVWPTPESLVAADPDRALEFSDQLSRLVAPIRTAKREAYKQAQRDAGQVWWALYHRFHSECREECFSLEEAEQYLNGGEEWGNLSADGIQLPDGTIITDWNRDYE